VDGVGRITDFGVARAAARITTSRPGMIKGKPCYMAPEQALGQELDRRADIFALGIMLWEILCGEMLFYSEAGDAAMLARVLNDPVPPPREKNEAVTEALEAVVMKALDRDPEKRFQTAREMAEALLEAAGDAKLIVTNHELGDRLKEIFADDVKARRASIQRHIEELGSGSTEVASDVFTQIPKLEARPSLLAPAPDSGAWHESSGEGKKAEGEPEDVGTAETKTETPSASPPDLAKPRPPTPLALAGIVLVALGLGAWVVASDTEPGEGESVGAEVVPGPETASDTDTETQTDTETAVATESETGQQTSERDEGDGAATVAADHVDEPSGGDPGPGGQREGSAPAASSSDTDMATHAEPRRPRDDSSMRPRMRPAMMGVVVETNPYLQ
jgi:serine/threonine-protein kinase